MQFLSKSALFHNQIEDRVEVIPEIEIQLLSTKLNEFTATHRQDLAQGLYKIKAIHMPFDNGYDTELQKESSVEVLEGVLDIAQEIAEIERERIIVVAHYTEKCVLCGKDTGVPIDLHVSKREYYVEGAGQCCMECYLQLQADLNKKELRFC